MLELSSEDVWGASLLRQNRMMTSGARVRGGISGRDVVWLAGDGGPPVGRAWPEPETVGDRSFTARHFGLPILNGFL